MGSEQTAIVEMDHGTQVPVELAGDGDSVPDVEGKGFGVRAGAYVIDSAVLFGERFSVVFVGLLILGKPLLTGRSFYAANLQQDPTARIFSFLLALVMGVLYFALCEWLYGATPGKLLLGLRVVKTNGERCSLAKALIRGGLRLVDGLLFGMPAYASMEPPLQQRIGDKAARTVVVGARTPLIQERRPWWWLLAALGLYLSISASAQIALMRFVDRQAAPGDLYVEQAVAAHAAEDHASAAEYFERAIETGIPEDRLPNIYFLLGNEYYLLRDPDKAIQAQERALELDPTFYPSWMSLGTVYWATGELDRAEECYQRFVELAPDRPEGYANLAWLYLERGNAEQAMGLLDQALQIDPHSGTAHAYQALAYAIQGRFEEAEASLQIARENDYADWQLIQEQIEHLKIE